MEIFSTLLRPNALKHGAFSKTEVLPWEDRNQFEEQRRRLVEEYQPEGPLEEDCVDTIGSLLWRKQRVRAKRNFDIAAALVRVENRELWEDPPPLFDTKIEGTIHGLAARASGVSAPRDDYQQLLAFSASLFGEDNKRSVELKIEMLPAEFSAYLNEKIPSKDFESTLAWIVRLKKEVDTVLLPQVRSRAPQASTYFERAAGFLTGESLIADLAVEERLDAGIERALKRLWQLKMARELDRLREPKLIASKVPKQINKSDDVASQ